MSIKAKFLQEKQTTSKDRVVKIDIPNEEDMGVLAGEICYVKKLTLSQRAQLEYRLMDLHKQMGGKKDTETQINMGCKSTPAILSACVCEEDGSLLMDEESISDIDFGSEWVWLVNKCMEVNHMSPEKMKRSKKK